MAIQLSLNMDYGVTREQACIMCHLSSGCPNCCAKCKKDGCQGQLCSQQFRDMDGQRWEAWIHIVKNQLPELRKFDPKKYLK